MDSLRYWVTEMHVDGFRFDLASALARELHEVDRLGALLRRAAPGPGAHRSVKLIAEPWDLGEGGYQVGNFPPGWAEWNDQYRDTMRAYWKGDGGLIGEFARRLTGSSDLYGRERPRPVREHQLRHRARRLHAARPRLATTTSTTRRTARTTATAATTTCRGTAASKGRPTIRRSARCASGRSATSSRRCCSRRACRCCSPATSSAARSAATTTPTARTTSCRWLDWDLDDAEARALLDFVQPPDRAAPRASGASAARDFFQGRPLRGARRARTSSGCKPDGSEMTDEDWEQRLRALPRRVSLRRRARPRPTSAGEPSLDDELPRCSSTRTTSRSPFTLPGAGRRRLAGACSTPPTTTAGRAQADVDPGGAAYPLQGRSLALLTQPRAPR